MMPTGSHTFKLSEIGMLASTIEDIDSALVAWVKGDLGIFAETNEGFTEVPVLWQVPERAFQIKNEEHLRDDAGAIKLPVISVERTGITKDPQRKGGFQANLYSYNKDGRVGRMVLAKRIVPDKTRNFAVAAGTRTPYNLPRPQQYYPRPNNKVVIQTLSIPIPIYINATYKITLKSEYQQQMNDMMTPFIGRTGQINSFVMRKNGHLYEAFIEQDFSHSNNVNNLAEDVRMFTSEITIRVLGYLVGEGVNDDRPIVRIDENVVEYRFPQETVVPSGIVPILEDE